jgi:hypothetical protein
LLRRPDGPTKEDIAKIKKWFASHNELTSGSECIKSGSLLKKGASRHHWQSRWFTLYPKYLLYCGSQDSSDVKGKISLIGTKVEACSNSRILEKHPFAFTILTPERTYYLDAHTAEERDSWVSHIDGYCLSRARITTLTATGVALQPMKLKKKKEIYEPKKRGKSPKNQRAASERRPRSPKLKRNVTVNDDNIMAPKPSED